MPSEGTGKATGLAQRVTAIRKDFGISQEEFGRRIGVRQSAISKYEKGYPMPKVVRIAVAATFGVSLPWLEDGKPPKYVKPEQFAVTTHDLELLRFLRQQNTLYDLIRFHLNAVKRSSQGKR
jgi:transcriptional regulator with XRE-family HTH domain